MGKGLDGRKLYTLGEAYRILFQAFRTLPAFLRAQKRGAVDEMLVERVMLAVTQVNRCALCSYAHTKMALEAGMKGEEISAMLGGDFSGVSEDDLPAILFAQHYADSRGKPSAKAWRTLAARYGKEKSDGILGAVRVIMLGNAYGIPAGSLAARFSKKSGRGPDPRSGVAYELLMFVSLAVFLPCALLQAAMAAALRLPLIGSTDQNGAGEAL